jgi:hypothetical protein
MMFAAGDKKAAPRNQRSTTGKKELPGKHYKGLFNTTPVQHGSAEVMVSEHVSTGMEVPSKIGVKASNYRKKSTKWGNKNR